MTTTAHRPLTARLEVRTLDATSCVVSTPDDTHHVVSLRSDTVVELLAQWGRPDLDLVDPALRAAAEPLRVLLRAHDGWAEPRTSPTVVLPGVLDLPVDADTSLLVTGDPSVASALAGPDTTVVAWDPRAVVNRAYRTGELLVVAVRGPRDTDLVDLDRMCHDMRVPWVAVELTRSRLWVGPFVSPGEGASFEDAVARRAAAAYDRRVHRVLRTPSVTGDCGDAPDDLPALFAAARRLLHEDTAGDRLHELVPDGVGVDARAHPVLPMPGSATRHRTHGADDLVDEVTGLVLRTRDITHDPSVPASLVTRQCDVADIRAVSRWANNVLCQGSAFDDAESAGRAALGESVERYCGNILDTLPVMFASYAELRRRGTPALDPRELVLYSPAQYAAPGFPFVPLDLDTRVHWVPGRSVSRDAEVWVPASLVYVNWYAAGFAAAPLTNFCAFAGIAAGPHEEFAIMSGLEEVVERHATMLWWLNGHPLPAVEPGTDLERLWAGTDPARQRHRLIALEHDLGIPVAAAVVHDDVDRIVNVGFSARADLAAAAAKAWTEALTLQEGSRDLLRMDGLHWDVMARGELNGRAFKPWREDRRYLEDFRPDMRDCDDLMVQQQVYLDPRSGEAMAHLLEPAVTRTLGDVPSLRDRSLATYRAAVEASGHEVIAVDLTTPDVASTGMAVVRVIVPGTVGNAPAAFPFLGRRRVQDLAVELGWAEQAKAEDELNYFPLPHA